MKTPIKITMKNVYGEEIYNNIIHERLLTENTKIADRVLRLMGKGYLPRIAVNVNNNTFRWDWNPCQDEYVPKYASVYIKTKMKQWFGIRFYM